MLLVFGVGLATGIIYLFGHVLNAKRQDVAVDVDNPGAAHQDSGSNEGRGADAGFIRRGLAPASNQ